MHWGDPRELGIQRDVRRHADFGDATPYFQADDVPVFWACGVTPQSALLAAKLPIAVTHVPGHMFVCDLLDDDLKVDPGPPS